MTIMVVVGDAGEIGDVGEFGEFGDDGDDGVNRRGETVGERETERERERELSQNINMGKLLWSCCAVARLHTLKVPRKVPSSCSKAGANFKRSHGCAIVAIKIHILTVCAGII